MDSRGALPGQLNSHELAGPEGPPTAGGMEHVV